uniref:Rho termination factor N-terminal domain-containing protein n=1 Tax=Pinguiococcus pyrenoidosus TaxID=172671 RepID=A0A7R9UAK8_9STRA
MRVTAVLAVLGVWLPCGFAWYLSNAGVMKTVAKGVLSSAVAFQTLNVADTDWSRLEERLLAPTPPVELDAPKAKESAVPLPTAPEPPAAKEVPPPPEAPAAPSVAQVAQVAQGNAEEDAAKPPPPPRLATSRPAEPVKTEQTRVDGPPKREVTSMEALAIKMGLELDDGAPSALLGGLRKKASEQLSTMRDGLQVPEGGSLERFFPIPKQTEAQEFGERLRDSVAYLSSQSSEERIATVLAALKQAPAGFEAWWQGLTQEQKLGVTSAAGVGLLILGGSATTVAEEGGVQRAADKKVARELAAKQKAEELAKSEEMAKESAAAQQVVVEDIRARVAGTSIATIPESTSTESLAKRFYNEQVDELHKVIESVQQELAQQREQTVQALAALQEERSQREALLIELEYLKKDLLSARVDTGFKAAGTVSTMTATPIVEPKPNAPLGPFAQLVEEAAKFSGEPGVLEVVEQQDAGAEAAPVADGAKAVKPETASPKAKEEVYLNGSGPLAPEKEVPEVAEAGQVDAAPPAPKAAKGKAKNAKAKSAPAKKKSKKSEPETMEAEAALERASVAVAEVVAEDSNSVVVESDPLPAEPISEMEVEDDAWKALPPSKMKRKTVAELQEFLAIRGIDTIGEGGKALRKPELLELVAEYLA